MRRATWCFNSARIINIPERVLLIKVTKMSDQRGDTVGYTLVFYDITDAVIREEPGVLRPEHQAPAAEDPHRGGQPHRAGRRRHACATCAPKGHYTWVHTAQGSSFCNLTIGDLEGRLDSQLVPAHPPQLPGQPRLRRADRARRRQGDAQAGGGDDRGLPVARASVPRLLERLGIAEAVDRALTPMRRCAPLVRGAARFVRGGRGSCIGPRARCTRYRRPHRLGPVTSHEETPP